MNPKNNSFLHCSALSTTLAILLALVVTRVPRAGADEKHPLQGQILKVERDLFIERNSKGHFSPLVYQSTSYQKVTCELDVEEALRSSTTKIGRISKGTLLKIISTEAAETTTNSDLQKVESFQLKTVTFQNLRYLENNQVVDLRVKALRCHAAPRKASARIRRIYADNIRVRETDISDVDSSFLNSLFAPDFTIGDEPVATAFEQRESITIQKKYRPWQTVDEGGPAEHTQTVDWIYVSALNLKSQKKTLEMAEWDQDPQYVLGTVLAVGLDRTLMELYVLRGREVLEKYRLNDESPRKYSFLLRKDSQMLEVLQRASRSAGVRLHVTTTLVGRGVAHQRWSQELLTEIEYLNADGTITRIAVDSLPVHF